MLDEPSELRVAFSSLPTGGAVVSMKDEKGASTGLNVGFISLSLSHPLRLFSLGKSQASARLFTKGTAFVVNILYQSA